MSFCKVNYVNVISHTSSVRSIIIISEYPKFFQLPTATCVIYGIRLFGIPFGFSPMVPLVSTDRIKVTEKNYVPFRICFLNVCQICSAWILSIRMGLCTVLFGHSSDRMIAGSPCIQLQMKRRYVLYIMFS